jgi:hypothetical protein
VTAFGPRADALTAPIYNCLAESERRLHNSGVPVSAEAGQLFQVLHQQSPSLHLFVKEPDSSIDLNLTENQISCDFVTLIERNCFDLFLASWL